MLCDEFADAQFVIERLLEPQPTAVVEALDPKAYATLTAAPGFIVFRLKKA